MITRYSFQRCDGTCTITRAFSFFGLFRGNDASKVPTVKAQSTVPQEGNDISSPILGEYRIAGPTLSPKAMELKSRVKEKLVRNGEKIVKSFPPEVSLSPIPVVPSAPSSITDTQDSLLTQEDNSQCTSADTSDSQHGTVYIPKSVVQMNTHNSPMKQTSSTSTSSIYSPFSAKSEVALRKRSEPTHIDKQITVLFSDTARKANEKLKIAIDQIKAPTLGNGASRGSSVRYTTEVRQGQHRYTGELLKVIRKHKLKNIEMRDAIQYQCNFLSPREQLDLLKIESLRGKTKKQRKSSASRKSRLERYFSPTFRRSFCFKESDLQESAVLGRGPGGQATNRRKQTCVLTHKPTNQTVRWSKHTSLYRNRVMARLALDLLVEKHELGDESLLGIRETRAKLKAENIRRETRKMLRFGASLKRKAQFRHNFFDFLCNGSALSDIVLSHSDSLKSYFLSSPPNAKSFCELRSQEWWELVYGTFCKGGSLIETKDWKEPVSISEQKIPGKRLFGWMIGANNTIPCWFCYLFPLVPPLPHPLPPLDTNITILAAKDIIHPKKPILKAEDPTSDLATQEYELIVSDAEKDEELVFAIKRSKRLKKEYEKRLRNHRVICDTIEYHMEQINNLQSRNATNNANDVILNAVRCMLEIFGLYMERVAILAENATDQSHQSVLAVKEDPPSWNELKHRLFGSEVGESGTTYLTPLARSLFPHMVKSLQQTHFIEEATAIRRFFVRHKKRGAEWAGAMCKLLK